ncbi:TetR/AcrR family transcriptional regulator [Streptomyces macrosporus]|uniref:TetR/AcrR family transcriptional regulator n=1 Tax=Streptomyces macrosporus TaxID=44032 RepID=A0ABP5X9D0_9ACTN
MARVSQEHLDARRRQILDGARRCFARNGFHATSMQDVLREVGLSAGAVYRYFRGKDELIAAIALEVFEEVAGAFDAASRSDDPPTPDRVLGEVMRIVQGDEEEENVPPPLLVQVWAETLRNEMLAEALEKGYARVRRAWVRIVETYQRRGLMRDDVPADHVARTLIGAAQGYLLQRALFGTGDVTQLENGLRALTSMALSGDTPGRPGRGDDAPGTPPT